MNCQETQEFLALYADGSLTEAETHKIKEHLKHCAACQNELKDLQMTLAAVQERSHVLIPQELHSHIMNRIEAEKGVKKKPIRGPWIRVSKSLALAAAIMLIFITSGNLFLFWGQPDMRMLMSEDGAGEESFGITSDADSFDQEVRGSDDLTQLEEGIEEVPVLKPSDDSQEAQSPGEGSKVRKVWEVAVFNVGAVLLGALVLFYMRKIQSRQER